MVIGIVGSTKVIVVNLCCYGDLVMGSTPTERAQNSANESNEKVADKNIAYQKEYNQQVFAREDTANQRAVSDMRAAGLNPLVNYNPSGSGGVAAAPQSNMHYDPATGKVQDLLAFSQMASSLQDQALGLQQFEKNKLEIDHQRLVNQNQSILNAYDSNTLKSRIASQRYTEASQYEELRKRAYDRDYQHYYGIHDSDSEQERIAKIIFTQLTGSKSKQYSPDLGYYTAPDGVSYPIESSSDSGYAYYPQPSQFNVEELIDTLKGKIPDNIFSQLKKMSAAYSNPKY